MKKIIFLICAIISNTALDASWEDLKSQSYIADGQELTLRIKDELKKWDKFKDEAITFITTACPDGAYTMSTMRPGFPLKKPLIFSIIDAGNVEALEAFIEAHPSDVSAILSDEGFDNLQNYNALDYINFFGSKITNSDTLKDILKKAELSRPNAYKPAPKAQKKTPLSSKKESDPSHDGWTIHGRT